VERFRRILGRRGIRLATAAILVALGASAGAVAFAVQPVVSGDVGPGSMAIDPSLRSGDTVVDLPPLGQLRADTHRGPMGFDARVERIDLDEAGVVAREQHPGEILRSQVERDLRPLLRRLGWQSLLVVVIAGVGISLVLPHRRLRYSAATLAGSLVFLAVGGVATAATFDPASFDQPEFEGALEAAPDVLNTVQRHVDDVEAVETRLEALSDRVVGLYRSVEGSSVAGPADTVVLHVSDLHSNPIGIELVEEAARRFEVDAIVDTGDLTSFGASLEQAVVDRITRIDTPYHVVPGNHDSAAIRRSLEAVGVDVLDPGVIDIEGIRLLGVADPTFTADNQISDEEFDAELEQAAEETRRLVRRHRPDVVAVHNPVQLEAALGEFDIGIAGHSHEASLEYSDGSAVVVTGSAGATGVGALLTEEDLPYEMQLLQFVDDRLVAVDRVAFEGTNGAFRLERILVDNGEIDGYPDTEDAETLDQLPG
jgi:predicted phosphodiesterase